MADVLASFVGEFEPSHVSGMYLLGIFLTAMLMVALPIIYLLLIGLAGYGVYYHLAHDSGMLTVAHGGKAQLAMLMLYLSPAFIGGVLIVFMIKPLFARPSKQGRIRSLTRTAEPVLFALVDQVCRLVRAPTPKRIDITGDVNASASFRRGWLSALTAGDLVLTIGMPLAGGLNAQQFTGVLAHEFGHFSQGAGMRLTYLIRSINFWFMRVVYHRDAWDDHLAAWARENDLRISWVFYLAQLGVWLSRKILWALMMLGHVVAGFMLRQMEFDADVYETRVAGSDTFESTARQLRLLNAGHQAALADVAYYYREGRLPDDLPQLIRATMAGFSAEVRASVDKQVDAAKTGIFDTHPADKDRIAAARRLQAVGVFRSGLPGDVLFSDFDATARNVTSDFYREVFGIEWKGDMLCPVAELISRQGAAQQAGEARGRFFGDLFTVCRGWKIPIISPSLVNNRQSARESVAAARDRMQATAANYRAAIRQYSAADDEARELHALERLLKDNVRIQADTVPKRFSTARECRQARIAAEETMPRLDGQLEPFEIAVGERIAAVVGVLQGELCGDRIHEVALLRGQVAKLIPVIGAVSMLMKDILQLRDRLVVTNALGAHLDKNSQNEQFIADIRHHLGLLRVNLVDLLEGLARLEYPFDHAGGDCQLNAFLLPHVPEADDFSNILPAAGQLLENLMKVYVRSIDRLCQIVETVEEALDLPPLELS